MDTLDEEKRHLEEVNGTLYAKLSARNQALEQQLKGFPTSTTVAAAELRVYQAKLLDYEERAAESIGIERQRADNIQRLVVCCCSDDDMT